MTRPQCPREQDVITAIVAGRWPDQCDETPPGHAAECEVCRDLVEVASLLRVDRERLHDEMRVPSAGQMWWRAAIRARLEASQQVARPLSWVFGVLVAVRGRTRARGRGAAVVADTVGVAIDGDIRLDDLVRTR